MSDPSRDSDAARLRVFAGELDDMAYREMAKRLRANDQASALLFGRDIDELAVRLASAGVCVVVDAAAEPSARPEPERLRRMTLTPEGLAASAEAPFDLVLGRLALHSRPYAEAREVLRQLRALLKIGGKLYLSAYGLHSTLGDHYADSERLVQERYAELPAALAELYDLRGPVCLYSERNLIMLLFEVGMPVMQSSTDAVGNVRAVAVRI